ncbi:YhdP family protein [Xenophilus arseniciresistens]|uniref:YhdP family protein n=1 Tax=Xenophilus arseniciresistens TaxID=1283306 RepID=A0AAE3NF12_9BURK|nr:YhdP family protein [Xenophilus arseniciresistens]MDA7418409.1 YhdP family protein [Xenophilus arseniciresistens]
MARWLLGLLGAAWLLFGILLLVLHAWIVPRIGEWRGLLETQASRAVGAPVRIGAIQAESNSLFPTIELHDVALQDSAGRDALRLARVVVSVSPRSVWRLGFEQLYIEQVEVDMRLSREGRLHVAGLDLSSDSARIDGDTAIADWFFAQREFVVARGTVRWTDEARGAAPLLLSDVRFVARNGGRRHQMRLDATPPEGWGQRFTLSAQFRQPLLSTRPGDWKRWQGQIHAQLPHIDVSRLGQYVTLDARIREGSGALRAWIDVAQGQPVGGVADLALSRVNTVLGAQLQPLVLRDLTGRVSVQQSPAFFEFSTQALQFTTGQGERWSGGNLWFRREAEQAKLPETGVLRADRLDLGALALIADRLPLGDAVRKLLASRAPQGLVEQIELSWQGPADAPSRYHAKGQVAGLAVAGDVPLPAPGPTAHPPVGTPGIRGLSGSFELNQDGGHAQLSIDQGALEFPGVFEQPVLPLDSATARAQWKIQGERIELSVPELRFANADAAGTARASWHTADAATSGSRSRFPGVLDLQGTLTRANGTRVWRYLPLSIPQDTRDYVQQAVRQGTASSVDFRVRGDLWDVPFNDPRQGEFRIAAKVRDVQFAYVPPPPPAQAAKVPADDVRTLPWPALAGVSGELIFERSGMQVRNARGHLAGATQMEVFQGEARIANMAVHDALLTVDARMRGPLGELTRLGVPLLRTLPEAHAFASGVRGEGQADYRLQMQMPLAHSANVKVQAQIGLAGNTLQLAPGTPQFSQVQGPLRFTESGFSLDGLQAQWAGGPFQVQGQGRWDRAQTELDLRAQGRFTAEGLRGLHEWPWLTGLARGAEGGAAYSAQVALRQGRPSFELRSDLQGLGLPWPAPLNKAAADALPLLVRQQISERRPDGHPLREHFEARLGDVASADYVSDVSEETPKLLQGAVRLGKEAVTAARLPASGAMAEVALPRVDVDAWRQLMNPGTAAAGTPPGAAAAAPADHPWAPSRVQLHTDELVVAGRTLRQVALAGTREGQLWHARIDARELSGDVAYNLRQAGRLHARLARLKIEAGAADQVESLLDEQPHTLPALDVVVDELELFGRQLGRLEIEAVNQGGSLNEWRLNRLNLKTPEAEFRAQGKWSAVPGAASGPRQTALDFHLAIQDAGALLRRFGMADVLARGQGALAGQVQWRGSPFAIDHPSLAGQLHLDVNSGQFLKAEPGIAKLLGVLSLQALPRRFTLDFRDIFSAGFAFDFIRGDARISNGVAQTNNLQMKGVNAAVLMEGSADIAHETQNLRVVVVPEINAGTAALVATAINPAIGIGAFLAQAVLSRPLVAATTREFEIAGTWADPRVTQVPRRTTGASAGGAPPAPVTPLPRLLPDLPALPSLPVPSLPGLPDWMLGGARSTPPTENHTP